MTDADAIRINQFYAARTPQDAPAPDRVDIATNAAETRWAGRGGPSTTIRISTLLVSRLYAAVPQPDRRPFVEAAIEERLAALERRTQ